MIKFFRKIRQGLLAENKFTKYLAYALGEILLVMIGILLAFQVNQWSEGKKADKLEKELISEVKEGLKKDLVNLQTALQFQSNINRSQSILIDWMDNDNPYHDSISGHIKLSVLYSEFHPRLGPYETLKQVGLREIESDSVRNQITYLYEVVYPEYSDFLKTYENVRLGFNPHLEDHLVELSWNPSETIELIDSEKMKSDNALRFNLGTLQSIAEVLAGSKTVYVQTKVESTLQLISNKLEKDE